MIRLSLLYLVFFCVLPLQGQQKNNPNLLGKPIFEQGDHGYACFRIPTIIKAKDGSIIAFAEARKKGCSDTGNIDLVMRKSKDHGKSWGPITIL